MPKPSVVANGFAVATKGTSHMCWATAPDVCKVPPQAIPTPFPNFVLLDKLGLGQSVQTTYANDAIFIDGAQVGPPSEPTHAGSLGGIKSSTFKMEAKNTACSPDVFVEGKGVVCFGHTTTQNHGNTIGIVTNAVLLALLLEEFNEKYKQVAKKAEEEKDDGDENDNSGRDTDGEEDEADDEDPPDEEEQKDEQVECGIKGLKITDTNSRPMDEKTRVLEVVPPAAGETITCETEILATHGADHPLWQLGGREGKSEKGKAKVTFRAFEHSAFAGMAARIGAQGLGHLKVGEKAGGTWGRNAAAFIEMMQLFNASPEQYPVNVTSCKGSEKAIVKAYPWAKPKIKIADNSKGSKGRSVASALNVNFFFPKLGGILDKTGLVIKFLEGSLSVYTSWAEDAKKFSCSCTMALEGALNPLVGLEGRFEVPWGPLEWLNELLEWCGVDAGLWIKPQGGVNANGSLRYSYTPSSGKKKVSGKIGGEIYIGVGIELGINPTSKSNRATAEGNCKISGSASLGFAAGPSIKLSLSANLGKLTGIFKVIALGFTVVDETVPIWDGYPIGPKSIPIMEAA